MKDIVIPAAVLRREFIIWLCCFVAANIVNWVVIIKFATPWYEIFTQVGYIVVTTLVLYGLLLALRVAWWILSGLARKK